MASPYLSHEYLRLEKEYDAVTRCNRCGFCETVCPTYMVSGKETLSPRGRNQAFRDILEGKNPDPKAAGDIFSTCLTCHACTNACFSQVPVARLMSSAREVSGPKAPARWIEKAVFRLFLPRRRLFSVLVWPAFLAARLCRWLGFLDGVLPDVPLLFGPECPPRTGPPSRTATAVFSGCGIHYLFPGAARAFLRVMEKVDGGLVCSKPACCGLIPQSAGDPEGAKNLARKVIADFERTGAGTLVVDDDSCAGFMKGYGELLDGEPGAAAFAAKVRDLSQVLRERGLPEEFARGAFGGESATYHDPCQMGQGRKETRSPREVLRDLSGLKFVELEESDWCCGGAGTYCLKHPGLSQDILERKLENIGKTGAGFVVTQAASCLMQIGAGIRRKGWEGTVRALHLAELLEISRRGGVRSGRGRP
ncbi:MAG: hypothetical protein A2902_06400 [Elusimicrobia bacterium RIFCSPLOWO2_01_FULL_64_13]|nr:MAG: hypothetical protein A2902_06400 [Elusimicrobia bacterium RIFCSPLOWO2_01_FULL_64_13]